MIELNDLDRAVLRGKALMDWYGQAFTMLGERTVEDAMVDLIAYREAEREDETDGLDQD